MDYNDLSRHVLERARILFIRGMNLKTKKKHEKLFIYKIIAAGLYFWGENSIWTENITS